MSDDEPLIPSKMSTGAENTLGNWRDLTEALFGPSPAVDFLDAKIADSPHGRDEYVIADEAQLLYALMTMNMGGPAPDTEVSP